MMVSKSQYVKNHEVVDKVAACLNKMIDESNTNNKIGLLLEHKYTISSLKNNGVKALKGIDNDRYNLLKTANKRLPKTKELCFNIINASLVINSMDDWGNRRDANTSYDDECSGSPKGIYEESDRSTDINEWFDANGETVLAKAHYRTSLYTFKLIVNPKSDSKSVEDIEHDTMWGNQRYISIDSYTGNEGMGATTTYNTYFLMFYPKSQQFNTLLDMKQSDAIDYLYERRETDCKNPEYRNQFALVAEKWKDASYNDYSIEEKNKVVEILEKVGDVELVRRVLSGKAVHEAKELAKLISKYKWSELKESLLKNLLKSTFRRVPDNVALIKVEFKINVFCYYNLLNKCFQSSGTCLIQ